MASPKTTASAMDRTWVEIDLQAVRHNAKMAQRTLATDHRGVIAVVKANAYGLGVGPISHALADIARAFGVANLTEALELRTLDITHPIYLLGPTLPSEWAAVAAAGFCPAISTLVEVQGLASAARGAGRVLPVHLVLDTGMGRIGALPEGAASVLQALQSSSDLCLDSIASHFPSADEDAAFSHAQAEEFQAWLTQNSALTHAAFPPHISNSAGLLAKLTAHQNQARAGLMLYGVSPLPNAQSALRPVVTWKARVSLVRDLPFGHGVSYGRTFITTRPTRVATLTVGYADGFPRQVSGQGASVLLAGQPCKILGRITMDQLLVDATDLPAPPEIGDEAVLLGQQGTSEITATTLAEQAGTIPWHLFTGIGPRVRRIYFKKES